MQADIKGNAGAGAKVRMAYAPAFALPGIRQKGPVYLF